MISIFYKSQETSISFRFFLCGSSLFYPFLCSCIAVWSLIYPIIHFLAVFFSFRLKPCSLLEIWISRLFLSSCVDICLSLAFLNASSFFRLTTSHTSLCTMHRRSFLGLFSRYLLRVFVVFFILFATYSSLGWSSLWAFLPLSPPVYCLFEVKNDLAPLTLLHLHWEGLPPRRSSAFFYLPVFFLVLSVWVVLPFQYIHRILLLYILLLYFSDGWGQPLCDCFLFWGILVESLPLLAFRF